MRVYGWGCGVFRQFQVALASGQVQVQTDWTLLDDPVFPHGAVDLETKEGVQFKMNGE